MKKALFSSLLFALTAVASIAPSNPLVGRWQQQFPGQLLLLNFRADGTYDAFINGKVFVSGKYLLKQDVFTLNDGLCNLNYYGTYKLSFYSGNDSIRFQVVQDTCRARRRGSDGLTLGRVKSAKP
jgi:hypothetical protein